VKSAVRFLMYVLPGWLKAPDPVVTDVKRLVQVFGELLDAARNSAYQVRRCWFVQTCPDGALPLHGWERDIEALPGEPPEQHRARLMAAFQTYLAGGTVPGIVMAVELLGHPGATVLEPRAQYLHDGRLTRDGSARYGAVQWAVFWVKVPWLNAVTAEHMGHLVRSVKRWKNPHTRLGGIIVDSSTAPGDWSDVVHTSDDLALGVSTLQQFDDSVSLARVLHDGKYPRDGTILYDGEADVLTLEMVPA
jgi:hypothetical protein